MRQEWIKFFVSTTTSSIWDEDPVVLKVFLYCLLESDVRGCLKGIERAHQRRCGVSEEDWSAAMSILTSPDPNSQTPDHDGRRIIRTEEGLMVVNKTKYNPPRESSGASTARVKKYRSELKAVPKKDETHETTRNDRNALEEKRGEERRGEEVYSPPGDSVAASFSRFWNEYPRKVGRADAMKAWRVLKSDDRNRALAAVGPFSEAWAPFSGKLNWCPHAATWLRGGRWADSPEEWTRVPASEMTPQERADAEVKAAWRRATSKPKSPQEAA